MIDMIFEGGSFPSLNDDAYRRRDSPSFQYNPDPFLSESLRCSREKLLEHIDEHFEPSILSGYGVPVYDIQAAAARGIPLDESVQTVYTKLADPTQKDPRFDHLEFHVLDESGLRELLVRSLKLIEHYDCAKVNWDTVREYVPNADQIHLKPSDLLPENPDAVRRINARKNLEKIA